MVCGHPSCNVKLAELYEYLEIEDRGEHEASFDLDDT
jgi:hypothetical protein